MMQLSENIRSFSDILLQSPQRKVNLVLLGLFLMLLPPQNAYSQWEIPEGKPVIRQVNIDVPLPGEYPVNITDKQLPWLSARSIIVVDVDSKAVLYNKYPDWQLYPASTTKMMTALVAFNNYELSDILTVGELDGTYGQTMKLEPGDQLTVENLLYGLLVQSGNDAALVLANNYPGGYEAFVEAMNRKAQELHLTKTVFKNPSGIETVDHVSTVHDLALLGRELIKNETLAKMVSTSAIEVTDASGEKRYELKNINQLVGGLSGVVGIKTGWTENAGECLVALVERDGRKIIVALLGSSDRFGETTTVINWVFANHQWQKIGT